MSCVCLCPVGLCVLLCVSRSVCERLHADPVLCAQVCFACGGADDGRWTWPCAQALYPTPGGQSLFSQPFGMAKSLPTSFCCTTHLLLLGSGQSEVVRLSGKRVRCCRKHLAAAQSVWSPGEHRIMKGFHVSRVSM